MKDILGKEITLTAYEIHESKLKGHEGERYAKFQYELDGETHITFTSSNVLMRQLEKYKDELPFVTTLIKPDRYITMS